MSGRETALTYQVTYVLGGRRFNLEVYAADSDEAYDMARFVLANDYPSASIQGKARLSLGHSGPCCCHCAHGTPDATLCAKCAAEASRPAASSGTGR